MKDKKTDAQIIGQNIKRYRLQAGFTQKDLASRLGIKPQQLSQYENGTRTPKLSKLWDFTLFLDVHLVDLLDGVSSFENYDIGDFQALKDNDEWFKKVERIMTDLNDNDIELLEKYSDFLRSQHKSGN